MSTRQQWAASGRLPEGLIYPDLIHSGISETLAQNTAAFNAASQGAIRLVPSKRMGDFAQSSFFKNVAGLISRRESAAGSPENPDIASLLLPADEFVSVKINRRIGPVDATLDAFKKIGREPNMEVVSFGLGEQVAVAQQVDWLDSGLRSVVGALEQDQRGFLDYGTGGSISPEQTLDTLALVDLLALFGDAAARIKVWVMHSKVYYDLVKDQITLNIDGVSNFNVATATPVTLNRPVLVTDSAALVVNEGSPEVPQYRTLGLTDSGIVLEESETPFIHNEIITGKENLVVRLQGEHAFNIGVRGFAFDVANGGVNPNDTALELGTNWVDNSNSPGQSLMDSVKDNAGVLIRTL